MAQIHHFSLFSNGQNSGQNPLFRPSIFHPIYQKEYMSEARVLCDQADYALKNKTPLMVTKSAEYAITRVRTYVDDIVDPRKLEERERKLKPYLEKNTSREK